MEKKEQLYEGKAKKVFKTDDPKKFMKIKVTVDSRRSIRGNQVHMTE